MLNATQNNPEGLEEQPKGLEEQPKGNLEGARGSEEPGPGQESESFTDITLDDVESVTPAELIKMRDDMHRDYTHKTTEVAAREAAVDRLQQDSDAFNYLMQHSEFRDMANRALAGEPLVQPGVTPQQQSPQEPDWEKDPRGSLKALITEAVDEKFAPLLAEFGKFSGYMSGQQRDLEYDNLCGKWPAAKSLSKERLNIIRAQKGGSISLEEAFYIEAGKNPALLTPPVDKTPRKKSPSVEQPAQSGGRVPEPMTPRGVRELQADIAKQAKEGTLGIQAAKDRVRAALRNVGIG